ncbi:MAG: TIGR03088 family PEP-CTERM/XrtA system glycosyltransferase [Burkholderiales bacterium]|nr:TIGR03088 family PEP-CTERM/XrtA system glycosyltransferase [Burkholderiales bacterium]
MTVTAPVDVVHVVYRFAVGGLENGLVNLVNRLPAGSWRHTIVSLTDIDHSFARRLSNPAVRVVGLGKGPGHALPLYPRLFRLFRQARPAIVHTRNLAALEATVPAWAAGVPVRVHGEHGRDAADPDGRNRRRQWIRKLYRPLVTQYVALSTELERYLAGPIGVAPERIERIVNGVDTARFAPVGARVAIEGCPFKDPESWLVGTVGRMETVKDQTSLATAFVAASAQSAEARRRMRLVIVGDGPLRNDVDAILRAAGLRNQAWLAGERDDIPHILRGLDCFVLPSLAEGVSNTILEAMATGLPVLATRVGANAELVDDGATGRLVPAGDSGALAHALLALFDDRALATTMGSAGRARVEQRFSLERMVERYHLLYSRLAASATGGDVRAPEAGGTARH